ncbi:DUF5712 family protein [Marinilabilia rubra]|nr:DUF5712 family protein [Marinilabilia rubra]
MYIKVINPKLHGNTTFSNTGSCRNLANYLGKENEKLPLDEKELFFNNKEAELSSNAVIKMIDNNVKGIAKGRTRFHSLVIAPDAEELKHIKHDSKALKDYTSEVMRQYAKSFNLKNGLELGLDDLVWAAKLEKERNGENKNGDNMHVHVIVSARDKEQNTSLSPNVNNKQRFNRVQFYLKSERAFDKMFDYQRIESRLQTDQMRKYGSLDERERYFAELELKQQKHQSAQQNSLNTNILQNLVQGADSGSSKGYREEIDYSKYRKIKKRNKKRGPKL